MGHPAVVNKVSVSLDAFLLDLNVDHHGISALLAFDKTDQPRIIGFSVC